jgi:hypothetical protein
LQFYNPQHKEEPAVSKRVQERLAALSAQRQTRALQRQERDRQFSDQLLALRQSIAANPQLFRTSAQGNGPDRQDRADRSAHHERDRSAAKPKTRESRQGPQRIFDFDGARMVPALPDKVGQRFSLLADALGIEFDAERGDDAIENILDQATKDKPDGQEYAQTTDGYILYRVILAVLYAHLESEAYLGRRRFNDDFRREVRATAWRIINRACKEGGNRNGQWTGQWDCQLTRQLLETEAARLTTMHTTFDQATATSTGAEGAARESDFIDVPFEVVDDPTEGEAAGSMPIVNPQVELLLREFLFGKDHDGVLREGAVYPETVDEYTKLAEPPPDAETNMDYRNWLYRTVMETALRMTASIRDYLLSPDGERLLAARRKRFVDSEQTLQVILAATQVMVARHESLDQVQNAVSCVIDRGDIDGTLEELS